MSAFAEFRTLIKEKGSLVAALRANSERQRREQPNALTSEEFEMLREFWVDAMQAGRCSKGRVLSLLRGAVGFLRSIRAADERRQARQLLLRVVPIERVPEAERDEFRAVYDVVYAIAQPSRDTLEFLRFWKETLTAAREWSSEAARSSAGGSRVKQGREG